MKPRIIIALHGGLVASVATNLPECEVVVIDYDLHAYEDGPVLVSPPCEQDDTFENGKAYLMLDGGNKYEQEAADQLKRLEY